LDTASRHWLTNAKIENVEEYQDDINTEDTVGSSPNLAVEISTSFPQSEVFGVKLVGHTNGWTLDSCVSHR